ncbi:MAG: hypothetical protein ABFQ62_02050 [Patescibacteria group bacterium]
MSKQCFVSKDFDKQIKSKYIFLDNDFISELFQNEGVFVETLKIFRLNNSTLVISPFTFFEFLRDIFFPKERKVREDFIGNDKVFSPVINTHQVFVKVKENALLLSKIYSHKRSQKVGKSPSLVDLFLAARVMFYKNNHLLITGNKKDFPSFIFDVIGVINIQRNENGSCRAYCVLTI